MQLRILIERDQPMASFNTAANEVLRNIETWDKKIQGAFSHKWDMDKKAYLKIFLEIERIVSEGGAVGVAKKELFQIFKELIDENKAAESEIKAFRAPIGKLFKDKAFGTGVDWDAYVSGFSTQDAFREFHRKTAETTEEQAEATEEQAESILEGSTEEDRIAAIKAILSGCDDPVAAWERCRPEVSEA